MSKVRLRNSAGDAWIPISAELGAVPDHVKAQTLTPAFRSICGLQDPPGPVRRIRNAADTGWVDLDAFTVQDPPEIIGMTTREGNSNQARFYPHANAQAGDLILAGFGQRASSGVSFSSGTATVLWQYQNGNLLAQPCIAAAIHTGASYYTVDSTFFNVISILTLTIRNTAPVGSLTVGSQTYSPSSQTKNILSTPVAENSLSLAWVIEEYANGVPYSYVNGNWQIYGQYPSSTNGNDLMVASYFPGADGPSGTGQFTGLASSNSGYTSQVIGVPPA